MTAPVLVCFAVPEEAVPFRRNLPDHVTVHVTGMGAAAAERNVPPFLADPRWRCVLTCGFAGGLSPALAVGEVIYDTEENFPLNDQLQRSGAKPARLHCAERVAVTAAEKAALYARTGADAVEMESGVIRRLCRARGLPSATVRVISDAAADDLPLDFNTLMKPDGTLHFPRLLGAVLAQPQKIPALLALGRRSRFAADQLASVLRATLSA